MKMQTNTSTERHGSELIAPRIATARHGWRAPGAERNQAADLALEVFVVHEDLATGLRAKQTLDSVGRQFKPGHYFHLHLWRFELLEDPALREKAVRDGSHADILFFSLHGGQPLPLGLRHWFVRWTIMREERPCALVVSVDEGERESKPARTTLEYLREAALACGVEVFPHFGFTANQEGLTGGAVTMWWHNFSAFKTAVKARPDRLV